MFSPSVLSNSLQPHGLQSTLSQSLRKFMSFESVMLSNHLIFCCPLLLLPSILPSIRVFFGELALHMRWPDYLLSPPDTSRTEHHFHTGTAAVFFLELLVIALCSSPVAYWTSSDLGRGVVLVFWCHIFCLFILFMGFSQQEYWSDLPFPPPMDHVC